MALIELGIIDKRTGELYDAEIKLVRKNIGGAFLRVFQQPFRLINNLCSHGATRKVMMELLASANYQNAVPSTTKIATQLNMPRPSVSRAYRELIDIGFLLKDDNIYYINPVVAWKGNDKQLQVAIDKWMTLQSSKARTQIQELPN